MVKCGNKNIHKNYSNPRTPIWSTLPEIYGIALGIIKEQKKKKQTYMKFPLLRAKKLTWKTDDATLQHMHDLFFIFFFTETQFTEYDKNPI